MRTDVKPIYPVEPWNVSEETFQLENNYRNETTFALSNGYIGSRGTFEEAYDFDVDTGLEGNFVNGFYESEKIRYGEANFGSPLYSQSLLNLPNMKETHLFVEGEEFRMDQGKISDYRRTLSMKDAVLSRNLIWESPKGKKVRIEIRRLVSMINKNIMAVSYSVTPMNFSGKLEWVSVLNADVENHTRKTNPIVDYGPFGRKLDPILINADGEKFYYEGITQNSKLTLACGCMHKLAGVFADAGCEYETWPLKAELRISLNAVEGKSVTLEKMIGYSSSCDMPVEKLAGFLDQQLETASKTGYPELERLQKAHMAAFWENADIEIEGADDAALIQGLHFNMFHIYQSAGRDGKTGMGAKGLSGEGYEGHYFWDTEMYVMPVFTFLQPEVSRHLLDYRFSKLDEARDRARILGHDKGALFPWRTINGQEASTYYPLGTAQYHINADIAYALSLYLQVTGDMQYLADKGAEILIETARVWADVGSFAECKGGKYCICSVTGPDEYNVLVDNNFYTNFMARENLRDACRAVSYMKEHEPEKWQALKEKLQFSEEEVPLWNKIIENMYFPYDPVRQVYPMDDGFLMRKPWDESKIPVEKRAWLYENYHPLFIMRHRMSKQADAIIAMYLHNNQFTKEEIRRNYDFYQEVTLHHSSLSTCIFGIVACDVGYLEEGYRYFSQSARMDLDDYHNNFYAGIHAANMAGTWLAIVQGFAGLRCQEGMLRLEPHIPDAWNSYSFKVMYRNQRIRIRISKSEVSLNVENGDTVDLLLCGKTVHLRKGEEFVEKIQSDIL